ncbi:MAG: DUF2270 domain-containing protein [Verrucomicrobiota bacterium]
MSDGQPDPIRVSAGMLNKPLFDPGYITAMSHFYRGEMSRIMAWRARLDTTTTWAITSTTTIFTVAFSIREMPHIIFFFNVCIVSIMLWIEARRYRFYDAFRARVRMLEAHFLVPMVAQNANLLHGDWQKLVCEDLLLPSFKISRLEAVGRRLKRNYIFIYIVILAAWLTKIFIHSKIPIHDPIAFYHSLAVSGFPSWVVATLFILTFITVISITTYVARHTSGEVTEFGGHRAAWRI